MTDRAELVRDLRWPRVLSADLHPVVTKTRLAAADLIEADGKRLAAQDQKPVAWQYLRPDGKWVDCLEPDDEDLRKIPEKLRALYLSPPPAAGWDIPEKITPELACIMENCSGPEMQTPEALATLVREYQPIWSEVVKALHHNAPPDTGAGESAPLVFGSLPSGESDLVVMPDHGGADDGVREALGWLIDAISQEVIITKDTPLLKRRVEAGIEALSHQPAPVAANASAEARLREALECELSKFTPENIRYMQGVGGLSPWLDERKKNIRKAILTHPHASDCDKQKECCDLAAKEPCPDCPHPVTVCVSTKPEEDN